VSWWTGLRPTSPTPYQFTEHQLVHGLTIGFLAPRSKPKTKQHLGVFERGEQMLQFDPTGEKFLQTPLKYILVEPDTPSENKQYQLITNNNLLKQPSKELPHHVLVKARDMLVTLLRNHGVETREIPSDDVQYNPKGSCGDWFNRIYPTKQAFVEAGELKSERYIVYRQSAHRLDWVSLAFTKGKREILPIDKIEEHNVRMFLFFNVMHFFSVAQDNQYFNKRFYHVRVWNAVGSVFSNGGFDQLIRKLESIPGARKYMGDVRKWDKNLLAFLFMFVCYHVRMQLYHGTDEEYQKRVYWQYVQEIYPYVLHSSGQVTQHFGSQSSGRVNTTTDNTLVHMFIVFAFVLHHLDSNGKMQLHHVLAIFDALIYSDDHLGACDPKVAFLASYETRNEFYNYFKLQLKPEDDKVQDSVIGLTFLGATIVQKNGFYVPQYNQERIRAGLVVKTSHLDDSQEYAKALALYLLASFIPDQQLRNAMKQYLTFMHVKAKGKITIDPDVILDDKDLGGFFDDIVKLEIHDIPTDRELFYFWSNLESCDPPWYNQFYVGVVPRHSRTRKTSEEDAFVKYKPLLVLQQLTRLYIE